MHGGGYGGRGGDSLRALDRSVQGGGVVRREFIISNVQHGIVCNSTRLAELDLDQLHGRLVCGVLFYSRVCQQPYAEETVEAGSVVRG